MERVTHEQFSGKLSMEQCLLSLSKWCKNGSWDAVWQLGIEQIQALLDMSSIQLDGTHTPAKPRRRSGRLPREKENKTSNMLIITDSQGIPLACSDPVSGNHNDAFELEKTVARMVEDIQKADIRTDGLFLNADSGFDTEGFRSYCGENEIVRNIDHNKRNNRERVHLFDELLYTRRFVIERTNAWLDAYKAILVRF